MQIANYNFTKYNIKHFDAALRQIDRAWEANKAQIAENWLTKIEFEGAAPLNKTVEGLYADFKRKVVNLMSPQFGGKNKMESDVNVNMAIERVLRSTAFQDKETTAKMNLLGRLRGSQELKKMQKIDSSITFEDILANANYVSQQGDITEVEGLGNPDNVIKMAKEARAQKKTIDEEFDETYNTVFSYTHNGRTFIMLAGNSETPTQLLVVENGNMKHI